MPIDPATGVALIAWVLAVREVVSSDHVSVVHGLGLVERDLPQRDARMITVTSDHVAAILQAPLSEDFAAPELPARDTVHHDQPQLVAGVHESGRMGVVRKSNEVEPRLLDLQRVAVLCVVREGIAKVWVFLMAIRAAQVHPFAVDTKTLISTKRDRANADPCFDDFDRAVGIADCGFQGIKMGVIGVPRQRLADEEHLDPRAIGTGGQFPGLFGALTRNDLPLRIDQLVRNLANRLLVTVIAYVGFDLQGGLCVGELGTRHKDAAARFQIGMNRVGHVQGIGDDQLHVAVEPAIQTKIERLERLSGGDCGVVAVVELHGELVGFSKMYVVGDIDGKRQIAAVVLGQVNAIDPNLGDLHCSLELQQQAFAGHLLGQIELFAIPTDALPLIDDDQRLDARRVRQGDGQPLAVIKRRLLSSRLFGPHESPALVEIPFASQVGSGGV